jgi:hypothetical protein
MKRVCDVRMTQASYKYTYLSVPGTRTRTSGTLVLVVPIIGQDRPHRIIVAVVLFSKNEKVAMYDV